LRLERKRNRTFSDKPIFAKAKYLDRFRAAYRDPEGHRDDVRKAGELFYILGDHPSAGSGQALGSTSIVTDADGTKVSEMRYRAASLWDKAWGEVRYESGASPTEYTLRHAQGNAYTGQYSYTADFGLMFYREASRSDSEVDNARWYDPGINHFTQPDTIVPDQYNPLDWNRYSYVRYNPLKYTDPTGHDPKCGPDGIWCGYDGSGYAGGTGSGSTGGDLVSSDGYGGESANSYNQSPLYSYTYDSMELYNLILPWSPETWGFISLKLDEIALGLDLFAGVIVLGHVGLGTAGTLTFEGNPAGAAGGYVLGELNPVVRGVVNGGNIIATFVTQAGLIQALKDGTHRNVTTLTVSQNNISISSQTHISGNAMLAIVLTGLGWAAQPVSLSLPAQYAAVQNDKGNIPLPSLTFTHSINTPIPWR
jgi:RHS repeat-associated protein